MAAPTSILLIANPRSGRAAAGLDAALQIFAEAGIAVELTQPASPAALDTIIRQRGGQFGAVVLAGGDGTVNAAAQALAETRRPFGLLPFGTANDLAHTLSIPIGATAARVIAEGHSQRIDLGHVNDRVFVNAASLGLPVSVAQHQDPELKRRLRALSYVVTVFRAFRACTRRFTVWITTDGQTTRLKTIQVTVGNGVRFGGGMRVGTDPRIDDGMLDVFAIDADTVLHLVQAAFAVRFGLHDMSPYTRTFRGHHVRVETRTPRPVNTDGEITTETPAVFSVERGALEIYCPPPRPAGWPFRQPRTPA